jgi:hypothetical protein
MVLLCHCNAPPLTQAPVYRSHGASHACCRGQPTQPRQLGQQPSQLLLCRLLLWVSELATYCMPQGSSMHPNTQKCVHGAAVPLQCTTADAGPSVSFTWCFLMPHACCRCRRQPTQPRQLGQQPSRLLLWVSELATYCMPQGSQCPPNTPVCLHGAAVPLQCTTADAGPCVCLIHGASSRGLMPSCHCSWEQS